MWKLENFSGELNSSLVRIVITGISLLFITGESVIEEDLLLIIIYYYYLVFIII